MSCRLRAGRNHHQTFEQFTLSCALVRFSLLKLSGEYVLKLFDSRFDAQLREDLGASLWSPEIEKDFVDTDRIYTAKTYWNRGLDEERQGSAPSTLNRKIGLVLQIYRRRQMIARRNNRPREERSRPCSAYFD